MKPKTIIAFTGPKGIGKTFTASHLLVGANVPQPAEIMSFAGPLKKMAAAILPTVAFTPEGKEITDYGLCGKTPRFIMQTLGTDWGRKLIGDDIWTEAMKFAIHESDSESIIIDDLRFDNEAELVKSMGGIVIALSGRGVEYTGEHESEKPISNKYVDLWLDVDKVPPASFAKIFNPECYRG